MNIKKIYSVFAVGAVLSVAFRFVQLFSGIELETGLSKGNAASFIFPVGAVLSLLAILFVCKFSYGVAKITEFEVPKSFSAGLIPLGVSFVADSITLIDTFKERLFPVLVLLETVLCLASAVGMLTLAAAVRRDSKRSVSLLIFCPVMLYSVKLISLFMTSVSIASSLSVSLTLFKIIFMLLFYLSTLNFLFNPDMEKSTSGVIFYSLSASVITLSDIIPNYVLLISNPGKYSLVTEKISIPDLFFCIYAVTFAVAVISSVVKKSSLLKSKLTEE